MKPFLFLALPLFSASALAQMQKNTTIALFIGDCRNNHAHLWGVDTVFFYSVPEDRLVFTLIPRQYRQSPILMENMQAAAYKVVFKNNFDQPLVKQIRLDAEGTNTIRLCRDSLIQYSQNTLSKMVDGDTLSIQFHSQGCFHTTFSRISISRQGDRYVARLYDRRWTYETKKKATAIRMTNDILLKTVTLSQQNLEDFMRFENELNFVKDGGCTTTDWYEVNSTHLTIQATDGSCEWDGFYFLHTSFFGTK